MQRQRTPIAAHTFPNTTLERDPPLGRRDLKLRLARPQWDNLSNIDFSN